MHRLAGWTRRRGFAALLALGVLGAAGCGTGGVVEQDPAVAFEPQGDTGPQGARTLLAGQVRQGFVEYRGDSDWYVLEIPPEVDTLRVEVSNQTLQSPVDLAVAVYADDGLTLLGGRYDPNGGDGLTQITLELTVEDLTSCYVVVRDHMGNDADPLNAYFLKATLTDGPGDGNNSPASASLLSCGVAAQDAIQARGDVDWFRVELPGGSDLLALSLSMDIGSPDLMLTLYESQATTAIVSLQQADGTSGPTHLGRNVRLLQPGTYYLSVRDIGDDDADANLFYGLRADCLADPDANEPNGNFSTSLENRNHATPLVGDAWGVGYLAWQGDEDWYRANMPAQGLLNVSVHMTEGGMPVDPICTVLAQNGQTAEAEFVVAAGTEPSTYQTRIALPGGVHYLRVKDEGDDGADAANAYEIQAVYEADPDANEPNGNYTTEQENRNHATPLVVGEIGTGYIASNADQDWFRVFVPNPGLYHFALTNDAASPVDLALTIYRTEGSTLEMILTRYEQDREGEDGPSALASQLFLADTGTYYLLVQDIDNNETDLDVPYRLQATSVPLPPGSQEPNEDREDAVLIGSGQLVRGFIEYEGDRDWYGILIPADQNVRVELWSEAPTPADFIWFMYYPDSSRVFASAGDDDEEDEGPISIVLGHNDPEPFWVGAENAGIFLFKLSDYNRNDWDTAVSYQFRVTLTPHVTD